MWKGCKSSPSTVQQRWLGLRRGRTWGPQATKSCPWRRRGSWRCPSDPSARRSCYPSPPLGSATSAARCGSRTSSCSAPRPPARRSSPRIGTGKGEEGAGSASTPRRWSRLWGRFRLRWGGLPRRGEERAAAGVRRQFEARTGPGWSTENHPEEVRSPDRARRRTRPWGRRNRVPLPPEENTMDVYSL